MGVILITHDLGVVAEVCTDVVVMYAGQVVESAQGGAALRASAASVHARPAAQPADLRQGAARHARDAERDTLLAGEARAAELEPGEAGEPGSR